MKKIIIVALTILTISFYGGLSNVYAALEPVTFIDTVIRPTNDLHWTHTIGGSDFDPNLFSFDGLEISAANMIVNMSFYFGSSDKVSSGGLFDIVAELNGIFLDGKSWAGISGEKASSTWIISISDQPLLNSITNSIVNGKGIDIKLNVLNGSLYNTGSSTIVGYGVVPEPGILSLIIFGLGSMPFLGAIINRRKA